MHTVSLFPAFFDYQMLGVFLIRVTLGLIFIHFWYIKFTSSKTESSHFSKTFNFRSLIPIILGTAGALLVVGLYTQGAAIATGILTAIAAFNKFRKSSSHPDNTIEFYIILSVASFSLLFLGAGAFAIDLAL